MEKISMEKYEAEYEIADHIYEKYEALLWDLIKDVKEDASLLKMANQLEEVKQWEEKK